MNPITVKVITSIAVINIDNPPVNALSQSVRQGLFDAIKINRERKHIKAMIITCLGKTFIVGADIKEFGNAPKKPYLPDLIHCIEDCEKPVIAAIHGSALGGGLEIAMGCHYRISTMSAYLGYPEIKIGLLPGATGTQRLPRLTNTKYSLDMMLHGNPISAKEALLTGIVDRVTEDNYLIEDALKFAKEVIPKKIRRVRDLPAPRMTEEILEETRKKICIKNRNTFAHKRIIQCVEAAATLKYEDACKIEREKFLECLHSTQSSALRHLFFAERNANKIPDLDKQLTTRKIKKISILGAGTMGSGIAYSCLLSGFSVHLLDKNTNELQLGKNRVEKFFSSGVLHGKISDDEAKKKIECLTTSCSYNEVADSDLVIEAVYENMSIKLEVFEQIDRVCKKGAILATNTSTLDIDLIGAATKRPCDVIGLHFFSPAHIMPMIEIVRTKKTANDVIATSLQFAKKLKKKSIVVGNCFGFVGNRMLYGYGRENQLLLLEGASPEYVDKILFEWGMAMGPNAVGDLAGLDVGYKIRQEHPQLSNDPLFYRIANMLVEKGRLGQKTRRGMYLYEKNSYTPTPDPSVNKMIMTEAVRLNVEQRKIEPKEIINRCILALIVEGARILEENIAIRSSDIDVIWTNGYGFPKHRGGPMYYADTLGIKKIYAKVIEYYKNFDSEYWKPPKLLKQLSLENRSFSDLDNTT